ncbi:MAG: hypothetical protein COB17_11560 [Sulfurimonas sp.]|nr:MAG: hypothetical protein COB17_11560 [Sulfurimonas sp.]
MNVADMNERRINSFIKILEDDKAVHFSYNEYYFEIFESVTDYGYVVNVYSNDEKDENNDYLVRHLIDGGTCTGSALDAILFML